MSIMGVVVMSDDKT